MTASRLIPVRFWVTTPEGVLPIDKEMRKKHLPRGPAGSEPEVDLRYGSYLEAVQSFLLRDDRRKILLALESPLGRSLDLDQIESIDIRTEKHGVCYQVARADVNVSGSTVSLAVNVAASASARSQLERDFRLLRRLAKKHHHSYLPRVYFKGAVRYRERGQGIRWLHMFAAEWFRGYHEFHLHRNPAGDSHQLCLWDLDRGSSFLSREQSVELYRQAARILTIYYDWSSFQQIYPWHHAGGDLRSNVRRDTAAAGRGRHQDRV